MTKDLLKIIDESGDKKYFTIVPNIVINHSTHYEQSLYLVMKRLAGETGTCFASQETLAKRMGTSRQAVGRTLQKLLKRGWIRKIGTRPGKTRPTTEYQIVDNWQENVNYYKKICPTDNISLGRDMSTREHKICPTDNIEEEPTRRRNTEEEIRQPGVVDKKELLKRLGMESQARGATYEGQDYAVRLWKGIGLNHSPSKSFFKLVKKACLVGKRGWLETAYSYVSDAQADNPEKLFYWKFYQLLKGKNVSENKPISYFEATAQSI